MFDMASIKKHIANMKDNDELEGDDTYCTKNGSTSSGAYAIVFLPKGENYAIKRVLTWVAEAYLEYAKFCKANHTKFKHLPKIYNIIKRGDYTYVVMEKLKHNDKLVQPFIDKYFETDDFWRGDNFFVSKFNPQYKILKKIQDIIEHNGGEWDIHSNNVMVRGKTPVITDPVTD